jgi:hypothetical protein
VPLLPSFDSSCSFCESNIYIWVKHICEVVDFLHFLVIQPDLLEVVIPEGVGVLKESLDNLFVALFRVIVVESVVLQVWKFLDLCSIGCLLYSVSNNRPLGLAIERGFAFVGVFIWRILWLIVEFKSTIAVIETRPLPRTHWLNIILVELKFIGSEVIARRCHGPDGTTPANR